MKKIELLYFKESGKYYTTEEVSIPSSLSSYQASEFFEQFQSEYPSMRMVPIDTDDSVDPIIIPHIYSPKSKISGEVNPDVMSEKSEVNDSDIKYYGSLRTSTSNEKRLELLENAFRGRGTYIKLLEAELGINH